MKRILSVLICAAVTACLFTRFVFAASSGTYLKDLTDEYDVNSDINDYGLDCDKSPMLCMPVLSGDFIQKWYCQYWTGEDWSKYFNKLKEANISMVIIQWTAEISGGQFKDIGFRADEAVSQKMSDSCTGNRDMLETMLKSARNNGIDIMIGLTTNNEWWNTDNSQSADWYVREAELVNTALRCIYNGYYGEYSDVICGFYWAYEMWSCNSLENAHLETAWANMLNITVDCLNGLNSQLPLMVCPYISKYYGTENADKCWEEFFKTVNFRDDYIIAPQDCYATCGYDLATVERHMRAMSEARRYSSADVKFWADVENYADGNVNNYIKQLRICAKYAERLVAFSYAHYYGGDTQIDRHNAYKAYADSVIEAYENRETETETETETESESDTDVLGTTIKGDLNFDGTLDIIDVVMARADIIGAAKLSVEQVKNGDMNDDGTIDVIDVAMIRKEIIG